ncbi:DUF6339 family protein [Luminiphilus sp.]|nr:DUF6339 family protein [Luminiphilus sp.]MDB0009105.1 DUF6339 family protein [Luminiphilus sp.]
MTLSVLTQVSVDKLRAHAKSGALLVGKDFDELVSEYSLSLIDSDYTLGSDIALELPQGVAQEENKDGENCLLIAKALPSIKEINATDERLWTTLCFREYSAYAIARWPMPTGENAKPVDHVLNHWFARGNRGLMRDNAVSRLWWYHQLCHRVDNDNVAAVINNLFFNSDYRSSMLERNGSSSITSVIKTIVEITKEREKQGITFRRDNFRVFMKNLNLLAGRTRLAVLTEAQLKTRLEPLYLDAYGAL